MRTTLRLDDDVIELVKSYAQSRDLSIGKAVSELVRRGANVQRQTRVVNGLQVFDLPPDSPKVTTKKVKQLESEEI